MRMAESPKPDIRKIDVPKADPGRPPPLPASRAASTKRAGLAPMKASLEIARLRLADRARRLRAWARRRPALATVAALAIVAAIGLGAFVAVDGLPELDLDLPGATTVADARAHARERPGDAEAQRDLGHALWAASRRRGAVAAYGRALAIDRGVADERLVANLVASFGSKRQRDAEALIWKNKLEAAQEPLEALVGSRRYTVRWGAVRTLDRLGKGTRRNWETAYVADLDSSDCDLRRNAVEKLGAIGTPRSLSALREAQADDEKTGGWFKSRCLGDRVEDAQERIATRR
jgi:hypothetical protein